MKHDVLITVVSLGGGLGLTVLGYLVWRHEQTIQAAQAAQQNAAQQAQDAATIQALQQQLESAQATSAYYGGSYGQTTADYSQVSGTTLASVPQDSNLAAILSAFFGQQSSQSSQVATAGSSTASTSTSPTGAASSTTTAAVTPSTQTQVQQIPQSLLNTPVLTLNGVTGINQQQASNPIVQSSVGALSGNSQTAVSASHTLATNTGAA